MIKMLSISILSILVLTGCSGKDSVAVESLQKKDKHLSCKEIMLEINEAEFYRKTAEKNKNPGVTSLLMPLGYITTYVDADKAVGTADARIGYLNRIYEILKCDDQAQQMVRQNRQMDGVATAPMMQAPMQPVRYMMVPQSYQMPQNGVQAQPMAHQVQPNNGVGDWYY